MNSFEIVEFNHCVKSNNCMTILVYNETFYNCDFKKLKKLNLLIKVQF